jgi:Calcineurin-like phosphoesterase
MVKPHTTTSLLALFAVMAAASASPPTLRLVHLSDTHCLLDQHNTDWLTADPQFKADILVHTGDFANDGRNAREFRDFDGFLAAVSQNFSRRVVVLGNHDVRGCVDNISGAVESDLEDEGDEFAVGDSGDGDGSVDSSQGEDSFSPLDFAHVRNRISLLKSATDVLNHEVIEIAVDGAPRPLRLWGAPWWPGHDWRYTTKRAFRKAQEGTVWPAVSAVLLLVFL